MIVPILIYRPNTTNGETVYREEVANIALGSLLEVLPGNGSLDFKSCVHLQSATERHFYNTPLPMSVLIDYLNSRDGRLYGDNLQDLRDLRHG